MQRATAFAPLAVWAPRGACGYTVAAGYSCDWMGAELRRQGFTGGLLACTTWAV